jgi:hypothetical protein
MHLGRDEDPLASATFCRPTSPCPFPCLPGSLGLVLCLTAPRASQSRPRLLPWRGRPPLHRASSVARAFAWQFASCLHPSPRAVCSRPLRPPQPRRQPVTSHRCSPCPANGPAAFRLPTGLRQPRARWRGRGWAPGRGAPTVFQSGAFARGGQHEAGGQIQLKFFGNCYTSTYVKSHI